MSTWRGGGGGFKIVDENGHGGRGGSGRMDVHFSAGVPSKNKSSCMNTLLSYEPFSVFQDIEGRNRFFFIKSK